MNNSRGGISYKPGGFFECFLLLVGQINGDDDDDEINNDDQRPDSRTPPPPPLPSYCYTNDGLIVNKQQDVNDVLFS